MTTSWYVGSIFIFVCAGLGVASVAVHAMGRWYATTMGRHLMAYMAVMAAILLLSSVGVVLRMLDMVGSPWFEALRLGVFLGLPLVMAQRLWLQIQARRTVFRAQKVFHPPPEEE